MNKKWICMVLAAMLVAVSMIAVAEGTVTETPSSPVLTPTPAPQTGGSSSSGSSSSSSSSSNSRPAATAEPVAPVAEAVSAAGSGSANTIVTNVPLTQEVAKAFSSLTKEDIPAEIATQVEAAGCSTDNVSETFSSYISVIGGGNATVTLKPERSYKDGSTVHVLVKIYKDGKLTLAFVDCPVVDGEIVVTAPGVDGGAYYQFDILD